MKKLIAMLLAIVIALSLVSVLAVAEGEKPQIVIDGIKDEAYTDERSLDHSYWYFYADASNTTEPVDYERVKNHVWFTWDDDFLYIYFEAVSKYGLYKPTADQTTPPDRKITWFEQINVYIDTHPEVDYLTKCTQGDKDDNGDPADCNHFCCNANDGPGKYYRVMARYSPAWDAWNNYYRSDEGMFLTYEQFCARRGGEAGYEDLQAMYMKENGAGEVQGFINYETNSYGFEMKYPRADDEYFQFNIVNDADAYEWEVEGPELAYTHSFCKAWWTNSAELAEIYYEDYPDDQILPAEVNSIIRQRSELPATLAEITTEHKDKVLKLNHEYTNMKEEHKTILYKELPDFEEFIAGAVERVNTLTYLANLGDINKDSKINANDALIALRSAVGKMQLDDDGTARADVNGDAAVNAKDALEILQFAVEKRTQFSVADLFEM